MLPSSPRDAHAHAFRLQAHFVDGGDGDGHVAFRHVASLAESGSPHTQPDDGAMALMPFRLPLLARALMMLYSAFRMACFVPYALSRFACHRI